ncbi:MAG: CopG family antitoxin [Lentisphaerae bacterium]|nr:CopG family antitoxin [Lentisphaerota bacterium]
MKTEYDLSKMKSRPNPYAKHLKKQVTMRIGVDIIEYFKGLSSKTGIPYQNLINLYLRDCASSQRELKLNWENLRVTDESAEYTATHK